MKGPTIRIAIIFAAIAVGILYLAQQPHAQETRKVAVKNMEPLKPTAEDLAPIPKVESRYPPGLGQWPIRVIRARCSSIGTWPKKKRATRIRPTRVTR